MKKQWLFFFVLVSVLFIGFFVEIINPHSVLGTAGAFARGILLMVGAFFWWSFFEDSRIKLFGLVLLVIMSLLYIHYGTTMFCQNAYYEKYTKNNTTHQYSCMEIIRDTF